MKGRSIKGLAERIVSGLKFNYLKEDDSELGRVDFGVLTVAMMIAALDGVVQPDEFKAFSRLAEKCRVSKGEKAARYSSALHSAGYMLLLARSGMSKRALSLVFLDEAERVLPMGFAGGKAEDVRRALVLWVTMGLSDGEFSGVERAAVESFCARVAEIMQKRRDCRKDRLWLGLRPAFGGARKARVTQEDEDASGWLAAAEKVVRTGDLAAIRKFIING